MRKAFTLIELLVVIAIIALLLAIVLPSFKIAKQMAQGTVCLANINSLSKAWCIYADDYNDRLIGGSTTNSINARWPQDKSPANPWVLAPQDENGNDKTFTGSELEEKLIGIKRGLLWPYIESPDVYHCLGDTRHKHPPAATGYGGKGGYRSYSIVSGANAFPACGDWGLVPCTRQTQIKNPSWKYVFIEETDGRGFNMGAWCVRPTGDHWTDPLAIWHNDSSTLGYADGHAERHKWLDSDTIRMAEKQIPNMDDPDSVDLEYMQEHLPYLKLLP